METLIGKIIQDRYLVIAKLGKGGGGSCYKVIDKDNNEPNASPLCLKILENSDLDGMLDFFMQEVEMLLAIDYPLIVTVYDHFLMNNGGNLLCYIMELCDGGDLRD